MNDFIFDNTFSTGPYFPNPGFVQASEEFMRDFQERRMRVGSKAWRRAEDSRVAQLTREEQLEIEIENRWYMTPCMRRRIQVAPAPQVFRYRCYDRDAHVFYYVDSIPEFIERDTGLPIQEWEQQDYEDCGVRRCPQDGECCGDTGCTPCHHPDTIQSDPFNRNDERQDPGSMELSMTVNREKLVEALKTKRDEVEGELKTKVDEAKAKVDELKSSDKSVEYLEKLIKLVKDGKATIWDYHGHQKGARQTEQLVTVRSTRNDSSSGRLPTAPAMEREDRGLEYLTAELDRAEARLKSAVTPYDAALQLLEMSADENVGIPASEYQRLLAGAHLQG